MVKQLRKRSLGDDDTGSTTASHALSLTPGIDKRRRQEAAAEIIRGASARKAARRSSGGRRSLGTPRTPSGDDKENDTSLITTMQSPFVGLLPFATDAASHAAQGIVDVYRGVITAAEIAAEGLHDTDTGTKDAYSSPPRSTTTNTSRRNDLPGTRSARWGCPTRFQMIGVSLNGSAL
jgi:hypothetical protein